MSDTEQETEGQTINEKGKRRGCLFHGCLTVALIVLVLLGIAIIGFIKAWREMPDVEPACEQYLDTVERGEYKTAYGLVNSKWQEAQPFDSYLAFEKAMHAALGKCKSRERGAWQINHTFAGATAIVTYEADYENGKCLITFTLAKEGKGWKVQGVNYRSPAIINALKVGKQ